MFHFFKFSSFIAFLHLNVLSSSPSSYCIQYLMAHSFALVQRMKQANTLGYKPVSSIKRYTFN